MNLLDSNAILASFGSFAVFGAALIIYLETATIFGSFLPGDSLLFLLGLALGTWLSGFPVLLAILILFIAAIAGSQTGFWFGQKVGPKLFSRRDTFFFNHRTVEQTNKFFARYGARAIILSRFVPVLRALIPMFVAIADFDRNRFFKLNLIGGAIWTIGLIGAGYLLGQIEYVAKHVELFAIGFVVLSSLPLPFELLRERLKSRKNRA
jgi:membrane-associated protein